MAEVEEQVRRELFFINYAPFIATSAKKAEGVEIIFKVIIIISVNESVDCICGTCYCCYCCNYCQNDCNNLLCFFLLIVFC